MKWLIQNDIVVDPKPGPRTVRYALGVQPDHVWRTSWLSTDGGCQNDPSPSILEIIYIHIYTHTVVAVVVYH